MGAKNSVAVVTRHGRSSTPSEASVVVARTRALAPSASASPTSSSTSSPPSSSGVSSSLLSSSTSTPSSSPPPSPVPTCRRVVLGISSVPFSASDERRWPLSVVAHWMSFLDVPAHCRFARVCRHFFQAASAPAALPHSVAPFCAARGQMVRTAPEVEIAFGSTCGCFGGIFYGASSHWRPTHVRYDRPSRPTANSQTAYRTSSASRLTPIAARVGTQQGRFRVVSIDDVDYEMHCEFWRWAHANPSLRRLECRVRDAWPGDESRWSGSERSTPLPPKLHTFSLDDASGALARTIASETLVSLSLRRVAFQTDLEFVEALERCPSLATLRLVSVTFATLALSAVAVKHRHDPVAASASRSMLWGVLRQHGGAPKSLPGVESLSTQNLQPRVASLLVRELRRTLERVCIIDTAEMQRKSDWGWRPDEYVDSIGQCQALTRLEFAAIQRPAWHPAFFAVPPSPGLLTYFLPALAWLSMLRVDEWPPTVVAVDIGCSGPHGHLVAPAPPQSPTPLQYTKPNTHIRAVAFREFEEAAVGDADDSSTTTAVTFQRHRELLFGRFPQLTKLALPLNHTTLAFALGMARGDTDGDGDGRARLSRVEFRLDPKRHLSVLGMPAPEFARRAFLLFPKVAVVFTEPWVAASVF